MFATNRIHAKHTSVCTNSNEKATKYIKLNFSKWLNIFEVAVGTHLDIYDTCVQEQAVKNINETH